jgi:ABC-2 type transport system permease protein
VTNALRIFFVGGVMSYRALFNWVNPWVFVPQTVGYPIFQILFFAFLGRYAGGQDDSFFLVGNAFLAIAVTGFFGMGSAVSGERRSQTLSTVLASPANRLALFLGRAVPSVLTGCVVAAIAFGVCSVVLDVRFNGRELLGLTVAGLVASFACTAFGLCIGTLGLRGRNTALFANTVGGFMLLVSGANVPRARLPHWLRLIGDVLPVTHGIAAARRLAAGRAFSDAQTLLAAELAVGVAYLCAGVFMLRLLEYDARRAAALDAF